jgi:hypothetical protein
LKKLLDKLSPEAPTGKLVRHRARAVRDAIRNALRRFWQYVERKRREKPFRFLGRRVVQAMVASAEANLVLGKRRAPARYLVLRLLPSVEERRVWDQQFRDSRLALHSEVKREADAREIELRGDVDLELELLSPDDLSEAGLRERLAPHFESGSLSDLLSRLLEHEEAILPYPRTTLVIESEPVGAQVYLDDRPVGVTPCRLEEVDAGAHSLLLVRPGYLEHEERCPLGPGGGSGTVRRKIILSPEPPMGTLEIRTFPPGASVLVAGERRQAPARWRVPAGEHDVRIEMPEFKALHRRVPLPDTTDDRPVRLTARLEYDGPDRGEVVGRLVIYRPSAMTREEAEEVEEPVDLAVSPNRISAFFDDAEPDEQVTHQSPSRARKATGDVLYDVPLRRGIILLGRPDPAQDLQPDIRLFDAENSVSRGCHAWIWIYTDRSTGAAFNTFLIGNNSPLGIRVDGVPVTETRRLSDDSYIELGQFHLRMMKVLPDPRVEVSLPGH